MSSVVLVLLMSSSALAQALAEEQVEPKASVKRAEEPAWRPELAARARLSGAWGFGFFGTAPVLRAVPGTDSNGERIDYASVPLLGLRHWTRGATTAGLEVGVGVMVSSASATGAQGSNPAAGPSSLELLLHLSAPIVVASTTHTIVFVAPEARFGFSYFDADSSGVGVVTATTLNVGVKGGIEIFFSFLGLPNLSLEAGVRAGLTHEWRSFAVSSTEFASVSQTHFATSLVANPWDLFTSSLAARYYF